MIRIVESDDIYADWIKTLSWDLPTDVESFLLVIGGFEQLDHFMTLPAAQAMPDDLKVALNGIPFFKHLAGRHDQSTHAGGRAKGTSAMLGKPKKISGETEQLLAFLKENPELQRYAGSFRNNKEAQAYLDKTQGSFAASLTPEESAAVRTYTSNQGPEFNRRLRDGNLTPEQAAAAPVITDVINRSSGFPDEIVVTRGMKDITDPTISIIDEQGYNQFGQTYRDMPEGTVFSEKGFTSTTANSSDAEIFAADNPEYAEPARDGVIMHIAVPQRTPAFAITLDHNGYGIAEHEVLFKPNQKFKLISKVRTPSTRLIQNVGMHDYEGQQEIIHLFVEAVNE